MDKLSKIIQKTNYSTPSQIESKPRWAIEIKNRYRSEKELLTLFNPSKQFEYITTGIHRCFFGDCPSIKRVSVSFNIELAKTWLIAQLIDLSLFTGIKEKPEIHQLENIAETIILNYGFLKLTEFMVFFQRFKAGKYGTFYGSIDGIVISKALNEFMEYRRTKFIENERQI